MAMFDYCQFILLNHSCEDYQKDNCGNCNMYKAYMKGLEEGAVGIGDTIDIVEVRRCIYESCKELFNNTDIKKTVYREIMNPLEDYLCDKEQEHE